MKKTVIVIAALGLFSFSAIAISAKTRQNPVEKTTIKDGFKKKKDGIWVAMEKGKKFWYKLDKEAKLWWSTDGESWSFVESGMWADKDGKWLKIGEGKLWWSADMGKTWSEVPEWKWQGPEGEWYKFDAEWNLWINK